MKKLGLIIIALTVLTSFKSVDNTSKKINWVTFEEALELQEKEPKKIMMDVYTDWCGPCKLLDKNTFQNTDVAAYVNKHYYAVKFNAEGNSTVNFDGKTFTNPNYDETRAKRRNGVHDLTKYFRVNAYPTILFFDEIANLITPVTGYLKPQDLELYLKLFKNNKHKEIKSQEEFSTYYETFEPSFNTNNKPSKILKEKTKTSDVIIAESTNNTLEKEDNKETLNTENSIKTVQNRESVKKEPTKFNNYKEHIVSSGETLSLIAKYYYNDLTKFDLIFEENKDILQSYNLIFVGQKLKIPIIKQ